jgi:microcystin-dependent protein
MSQPFLGQLMLVPYNFAPQGWAFCEGQTLPISQNTALFSLLGTTYGGNGTSTFQLPNLQGCVPVGQGQGPSLSPYDLGETAGSSSVTVLTSQMPAHTHIIPAAAAAGHEATPGTGYALGSGSRGTVPAYVTPAIQTEHPVTMSANLCGDVGGSQPHNNLMPYVVMNYIIALTGIYPARS